MKRVGLAWGLLAVLSGCSLQNTVGRNEDCIQDNQCISPLRCLPRGDGRKVCNSLTPWDAMIPDVQSSDAPRPDVQSTDAPASDAQSSDVQSSDASASDVQSSDAPDVQLIDAPDVQLIDVPDVQLVDVPRDNG